MTILRMTDRHLLIRTISNERGDILFIRLLFTRNQVRIEDMAIRPKQAPQGASLEIQPLKQGRVRLRMLGTTPLYFNSMSSKAMRDLLAGGGKKTTAQKKEIKHNPEKEFRESVYTKSFGDTLLCFPAPGVKGAMSTAALETDGITKSSVQRLIFLPQTHVQIWGKPQLKIDIVRSADMNRTPDMRTRAYLPRWCAEVDIAYVQPALSAYSIVSLLTNAGVVVGIGDFRQEKGRGSFGTFSVLTEDSMGSFQAEWDELMVEGRESQQAALDSPVFADSQTEDLMQFMVEERARRDITLVA